MEIRSSIENLAYIMCSSSKMAQLPNSDVKGWRIDTRLSIQLVRFDQFQRFQELSSRPCCEYLISALSDEYRSGRLSLSLPSARPSEQRERRRPDGDLAGRRSERRVPRLLATRRDKQ